MPTRSTLTSTSPSCGSGRSSSTSSSTSGPPNSLTWMARMARGTLPVLLVPVHRLRREGRQAHGHVLGASGLRGRVADPLAAAHQHRASGAHAEVAVLVLHVEAAVEHDRVLVELGPLPRLAPALGRAHPC